MLDAFALEHIVIVLGGAELFKCLLSFGNLKALELPNQASVCYSV